MGTENSLKDHSRPDPDALLKEVQREEAKRGRLKIFLGYAPGVGKTYTMLNEAHVLKKRGEDVVVGIVETHGRSETEALLKGLEVIPRRRVEYQGIVLEELDLDAIHSHDGLPWSWSMNLHTPMPRVAAIPNDIGMLKNCSTAALMFIQR